LSKLQPATETSRHVLGEELSLFPLKFKGSIRVEARPDRLTSDAGAIALREGLERLGMVRWLKLHLHDERSPLLITYPLVELATTAILLLAQGYRDHDRRRRPARRSGASGRRVPAQGHLAPAGARAARRRARAAEPVRARAPGLARSRRCRG
jgi:hypothetical protein